MISTRTYFWALACLLAAILLASCTEGMDDGAMGGHPPPGENQEGGASGKVSNGVKQQAIARMQETIQHYQRIASQGGWPTIPEGEAIEPGDSTARIIPLRRLLTITGDLPESAAPDSGNIYAPALVGAVMQFQVRHGLEPDGVIGTTTIAALNTPVEERLSQLRTNLQRLAALPDSMGRRFVLVNIPEYKLRTYENGQPVQEMAVIVGEEFQDQQTPRFSDEMEYVIFRPYWNVPDRIAAEEIVPEVRRNPGYMDEHNYEITSNWGPDAEIMAVTPYNLDKVEAGTLKIRQKPGERNALGLVKFMFPNQYAVYLHGTPADHLFREPTRAFSHGCIRVEKPVDLAEFVLKNQPGWTRSEIEQAMKEGEETRVNLDDTIPVHIVYLTAYVDDTGSVRFFEDVYGLQDDGPAVMGGQASPVDDPNALDQGR